MNAHKFVADFGIERAKSCLYLGSSPFSLDKITLESGDVIDGEQLKQVVESVELIVNDFESVEIAEYEYMICASQNEPYWVRLKQAIADFELVESYKENQHV